jgi:hypothetical protein
MEREIIGSWVAGLPETAFGKVHEDDEMWQDQDGEAEIKVTRHVRDDGTSMVALSVAGPQPERNRVILEFSEVFGEPTKMESILAPTPLDFVLWKFCTKTQNES